MGNQPTYQKKQSFTLPALLLMCGAFLVYFFAVSSPDAINCGNATVKVSAVEGAGIEAAINAAAKEHGFELSNAHEAALTIMPRSWNSTDSVTIQLEQGEKRVCKIDGNIVWAQST